ncbi:MAG: helicase-associated domain-containing protein [Chloroflexota bacterium]|nr:helicase-associated domain-containing protein [Chloroflexota bacterium]MDE2948526.1 helicase-associated domain-containing protein [Chloroflexota bacterium]
MNNLFATLRDYDPGMLLALAETWRIDSKGLADDDMIRQLQAAMLDPQTAETVWDQLDEPARAALQLLVSSSQGRMKIGQFERFYGKIRKLGRAQIEREQPHIAGRTIAETLYYRGLIGEGFDNVDGNLIGFIFVPTDFISALPLHKTSYEALDAGADIAGDELPALGVIDAVDEVSRADTSIVDDLATLLALLQARPAELDAERIAPASAAAITPYLLQRDENRLSFMLAVAISANLISTQDGQARPKRDEARSWLEAARARQIQTLATAWLESASYRDMWHIPGLQPEDSGWSYDAAAARRAVMSLLADLLPDHGWVSINDIIDIIKEFEPDFQRPDGDYESWYIRNDAGEFLTGFESWDAVEGSLIEFYLVGPMHWLGLVDIGEDVTRLTAYGRAFLEISDWPKPVEPEAGIDVQNDGTLLASRRVNRFERFQLARFAHCLQTGDPYVYRIDAASIQRAAAQDIHAKHIQSFIVRHLEGDPLPLPIIKFLRNWQAGAQTSVALETMIVLRTTSEETLDKIFATPAFRRFLGARLGPMACAVRADQWEALRASLAENAIEVDISRLHNDFG